MLIYSQSEYISLWIHSHDNMDPQTIIFNLEALNHESYIYIVIFGS